MSEEDQERVFVTTLEELTRYLGKMYSFDPWLCSKGYPITLGDGGYWVLISPQAAADVEAGDHDTIGRLRCFVQMPVEPVVDQPAGYGTVFIPHQDGVDATEQWRMKGYVLLHKDHVTSKGTILTLTEKQEAKAEAMIADNRKLPQWALDRGHPMKEHFYYFTDDERLMVRCPSENADLNLFSWECPHEPKEAKPDAG